MTKLDAVLWNCLLDKQQHITDEILSLSTSKHINKVCICGFFFLIMILMAVIVVHGYRGRTHATAGINITEQIMNRNLNSSKVVGFGGIWKHRFLCQL